MINLIFSPIYKTLEFFQKTVSLAIANWPFTILFLGLGLTFEELYYGFKLIKLLGVI